MIMIVINYHTLLRFRQDDACTLCQATQKKLAGRIHTHFQKNIQTILELWNLIGERAQSDKRTINKRTIRHVN